jgi:uncharacterized protein YbjT (DUF2867 family)
MMIDSDFRGRRILLLGATGFIGAALAARLTAEGAAVVAVVRRNGRMTRKLAVDAIVDLDLRDAVSARDWTPHLNGIDLAINCAGVLQDGARDSTHAVHEWAPAALISACEKAGVRRFIHFSAMGADKAACSEFSLTKGRAEALLRASSLDWVILRPSVVVGRAAYGGSALFRGLASLPWLPRLGEAGPVSVVQLDDVVETVVRLVPESAPSRIALDLAGPEALNFDAIVARYRSWLGWNPARAVSLPQPVMTLLYKAGDLAGRLGWRPPVRTTARREMRRGASGDPSAWSAALGIVPRALSEALQREPASVQERWFARLYLLKPAVITRFALFWLLTGFVSLGPGYDIGTALMVEGGAGALSGPVVIAGGLADLAIGLAILWRPATRMALWCALVLTLVYVIAGTAILPRLWEEPLGPMMKVWPIIALNFVALAILEDR